jgi:hypothetical protein
MQESGFSTRRKWDFFEKTSIFGFGAMGNGMTNNYRIGGHLFSKEQWGLPPPDSHFSSEANFLFRERHCACGMIRQELKWKKASSEKPEKIYYIFAGKPVYHLTECPLTRKEDRID